MDFLMFLVDLSVVPCLSGKSCDPGRSFEASRRARAGKDLCFLRMRPALYRLSLVYCCAKEGKAKLDVLFFLLLQLENVPSVAVEPIWERKTGRVAGSRAGPRP